MAASGSDLQRSPRQRLTLDVREVPVHAWDLRRRRRGAVRLVLREKASRIVQGADRFLERSDTVEFEALHDGGFGMIRLWKEQAVEVLTPGSGCDGKDASC